MFEARPAGQRLAVLTSALILAACASRGPAPSSPTGGPGGGPKITQWPDKDGPERSVPADLDKIPDALPRLEPIRKGGPNKPYVVAGTRYEPVTGDDPQVQRGLASWYGRKFHGKPTSSGEIYNMYAMTAAHATMPIPSYARVRNPKNGREVIVRINDRGPFHPGRIIDLSYTAALKLDVLRGVAPVEIERITYEDIRTGAWMRGRDPKDPTLPALPGAADAPLYAAATPSGAPEPTTTAQVRPPARAAQDLPPAPRVTATTPATTTVATAPSVMTPIPITALPAGADLDRAAADPRPQPAVAAVTMVDSPAAAPAAPLPKMQVAAAPGIWLQLGAFSRLEGAESQREQVTRELDWLAPLLAIFKDRNLHRLQAGPFSSREDARAAAERVRQAMALTPVLVERR